VVVGAGGVVVGLGVVVGAGVGLGVVVGAGVGLRVVVEVPVVGSGAGVVNPQFGHWQEFGQCLYTQTFHLLSPEQSPLSAHFPQSL